MTTVEHSPNAPAFGQLTVDRPRLGERKRVLSPGWPLTAYLLGYPVWWALGIANFMLPILAVPMAVELIRRRNVTVPRGFGLWLLFLLWTALGVFVLWVDAPGAVPGGGPERLLPYGLRLSFYLGATVLLLYIGNLREDELSRERVSRLFGFMFVVSVAGGFLGILAPRFGFSSLLALILPGSIEGVLGEGLHPAAAQVQNVLGYAEPRPKAPFDYTNEWGANITLLVPFFILGWLGRGAGWRRLVGPFVLAASVVPIIYSLNRGAWIGLCLAAGYVALRLAASGRLAALVVIIAALVTASALLVASPLGSLVGERLANPHSNERRAELAGEAVGSALASPVVGFGSTRPVQGNLSSIAIGGSDFCPKCESPPFGTHGHLWLLIFAQGLVGAALFFGFLATRFLRHRRDPSPYAVAACTTVLMFALYTLYYNLLPFPLAILCAALAIAWRAAAPAPGGSQPATERRAIGATV